MEIDYDLIFYFTFGFLYFVLDAFSFSVVDLKKVLVTISSVEKLILRKQMREIVKVYQSADKFTKQSRVYIFRRMFVCLLVLKYAHPF